MRGMQTPSSAGTKLAGFAVAVALVFGATFGVARAVAPDGAPKRADDAHDMDGTEMDGMEMPAAGATPPGLAVAQDGYRFVAEATNLASGPAVPFRFRLEGPDGPVQRYEQLHERELHLIVVRRDLTGFQHVHPTRAADGTWAIDLDLRGGGTWRAFADFAPTGGPAQLTLGLDLQVAGAFEPGSAPTAAKAPDPSLDVRIDRGGDDVEITVRRDGEVIQPEPYLGARGHLVALRAGDLAYLHVHPLEGGAPAVRFMAHLPTVGPYSLFFDYQVGGVVHTATTSIEVK